MYLFLKKFFTLKKERTVSKKRNIHEILQFCLFYQVKLSFMCGCKELNYPPPLSLFHTQSPQPLPMPSTLWKSDVYPSPYRLMAMFISQSLVLLISPPENEYT